MTRPTYMYRLTTRGDIESRIFDAEHDNFSQDTKDWACSPADLSPDSAGSRKRRSRPTKGAMTNKENRNGNRA